MTRLPALAGIGLLLLAGGCATTGMRAAPVDVTRYHLDQPAAPGSVAIEAMSHGPEAFDYPAFRDAIGAQLNGLGFTAASDATSSAYIAAVGVRRVPRGTVQEPPPVSIGLGVGGASFGRHGGVGVGGDVGIPVGRGRQHTLYATELQVDLRRRSDGTVIWQGRAVSQSVEGRNSTVAMEADRMARALFKGFPGQSGVTITVK